jgi:hypothetical protein
MKKLLASLLLALLASCGPCDYEGENERQCKFSCGSIAEVVLTGERCMIVGWYHHHDCMCGAHKHFDGFYDVRMMDNSKRKVQEYELRQPEQPKERRSRQPAMKPQKSRDLPFKTWDPETGEYK